MPKFFFHNFSEFELTLVLSGKTVFLPHLDFLFVLTFRIVDIFTVDGLRSEREIVVIEHDQRQIKRHQSTQGHPGLQINGFQNKSNKKI